MKTAYRALAYLLAGLVLVQAAAIAYAIAGLGYWVSEDGGVLDKALMESDDPEFSGLTGFMVHGMNGMMVIPLLSLVLLIVSFFAKIPGGVKWAGFVLLAVVAQIALAFGAFAAAPVLGWLHGMNALVIVGLAINAARRAMISTPAAASRDDETVGARAV